MKARGLLGVLACAAALVAPAGASAKPGYFTSPHFHYAKVQVDGSNGYHLEVQAFTRNVNVNARKGQAQVSYFPSRGWLRDDRVWSLLPGIGRIDIRFHEQDRFRKDPPDNCKGAGALIRSGYFKGTIEIEGEDDYMEVHLHSVRGKIIDEPKEICRDAGRSKSSGAAQEELVEASSRRGRGVISFFANEWEPFHGSRPVFFNASLARFRRGMLIINSVGGFNEDPQVVSVGKPPVTASVTPPQPFTGSASFQREPDGSFSWLGDLAAELPGIGSVALAGPEFEARACLGKTCRGAKSPGFLP